ncbi:hypothetical protein D3C76_1139050 [compost metagenome]
MVVCPTKAKNRCCKNIGSQGARYCALRGGGRQAKKAPNGDFVARVRGHVGRALRASMTSLSSGPAGLEKGGDIKTEPARGGLGGEVSGGVTLGAAQLDPEDGQA